MAFTAACEQSWLDFVDLNASAESFDDSDDDYVCARECTLVTPPSSPSSTRAASPLSRARAACLARDAVVENRAHIFYSSKLLTEFCKRMRDGSGDKERAARTKREVRTLAVRAHELPDEHP